MIKETVIKNCQEISSLLLRAAELAEEALPILGPHNGFRDVSKFWSQLALAAEGKIDAPELIEQLQKGTGHAGNEINS